MGNRLTEETSPYLLQHKDQPVDWFPWGEEAFKKAQRENKPILLSVGYSACHWCHVMAHESFDDPAIAALMNNGFVNIKVDREERPDVDRLYMRAVQAFNQGRGGWPMTAFLTPEGQPFFGGTYFPPEAKADMPAFRDVLAHVRTLWTDRKSDVSSVIRDLQRILQPVTPAGAGLLAPEWLTPVVESANQNYDARHGGFGEAPKFPPHGLLWALSAHVLRCHDETSLSMFTRTLDGMAKGGMYDLLGGGFARYSVDVAWRVPHFEKMLYDNAQLIPRYVEAWQLTGEARYARIVRETVAWALDEMQLPHGGFAASQDADSEGSEGAYFVWTPDQLVDVLGAEDGRAVAALLEVTASGTFKDGTSVLRLSEPLEKLGKTERARFLRARTTLLDARRQRIAPDRDDKVIVSWNALMISALANAAGPLAESAWLDAAIRAADMVLKQCRDPSGRLMRTFKDGRVNVAAYADDVVNLLTACLDLWDATSDLRWLNEANSLADLLVQLFWDDEDGGFFLLGKDQPPLVAPSKPFLSNAEPAPNAMAALAFLRLARLSGDPARQEVAETILRMSQRYLNEAPQALGADVIAGSWLARGGIELAIVGDRTQPETQALLRVIERHPMPFAVRYVGPPLEDPAIPWLEGKTAIDGKPTAYLCEGYACQLPVHTPEELHGQLDGVFDRTASLTSREQDRAEAPALPQDPERWIGLREEAPLPEGYIGVLHFWTACSINARHVLPELTELEARYAVKPVRVIGVHASKFDHERERAVVEKAMERLGVRHPVLLDPDHDVWDAFGVRSWPTVVVIDRLGRVAALRSGETTADDLADLIDTLLAEDPAEEPTAEAAWDSVLAAGGQIPSDAHLEAPARARDEASITEESPKPLLDGPVPASNAVPSRPITEGVSLRFPGRVHVWPDAYLQEIGQAAQRVYIADSGNHRIIEAELRLKEGWPFLVPLRAFGNGEPGFTDGGAETSRFRNPQGIRRAETTLYVADTGNHALRSIDLITGKVTTLAGNGERGQGAVPRERLATPKDIALRSPWGVEVMIFRDEHLVFVTMAGSHQIWVYANGHIGMHTGNGRADHVDGPAAAAALAQPTDAALYGRYLLFIDSEVSSVRAVDPQSHQVVTVVGRGLFDFGDIDGGADVARLQHPLALTFAGEEVFVADTYNQKVKQIALSNGRTRTLAGGDGEFDEPSGIARAGAFLIVSDTNHHRIAAVRIDDGEVKAVPWAS
ncbi:MAG: DUF255 domain-containing protein [Myxococcota bacterium]